MTKIYLIAVKFSQERLPTKPLEREIVPRKGESLIIGMSTYLINDVIWHENPNEVSFHLVNRNHGLLQPNPLNFPLDD